VLAYARANRLDRVEFGRPGARLGLVSAGKAAVDVRQALALLGLDEADAEALGLALYRPRLIWPLEPEGIAAFARGCDELLVVEEKLPFVEPQVASALFNLPAAERPRLLGKRDLDGSPLVPAHGQLDPVRLARLIGARLLASEAPPPGLAERLERLDRRPAAASPGTSSTHRLPYFCAGCPHNTSTKVPEGSIALSGIGCHTMALWMDRDTLPPTQMGGEGANWNGIAPFSDTPHLFQNIGDGTYAHSGLLAIRAAAAAGTRITYKLLYNDAVAMTGGQPVEGSFTVADIARQLLAEKVQRVVVVSDEPDKYLGALALPPGVDAFHRNRLDEVQRELREIQGTTVLIYDQACATEKRRRRKRGRLVEPDRAVFINHRVCEGCGDCSVQANCVALTSRETPFGRKRQVDQSVCNKDYSCLRGFCPALVTVEGGRRRRPAAAALPEGLFADLPSPTRFDGPCNVLVTGIGGTGVVTVGALLSTAAHLDGLVAQAFDLTGLAQKNGAVFSHLRLGGPADGRRTARLGPGESDLLLGCDLVVAASDDAVASCDPERTRAVVNTAVVPTAQLQLDPDVDFHTDELLARVETAVSGHVDAIDAAGNARRLLGDTIGSNLFLVGVALQRGLLPVTLAGTARRTRQRRWPCSHAAGRTRRPARPVRRGARRLPGPGPRRRSPRAGRARRRDGTRRCTRHAEPVPRRRPHLLPPARPQGRVRGGAVACRPGVYRGDRGAVRGRLPHRPPSLAAVARPTRPTHRAHAEAGVRTVAAQGVPVAGEVRAAAWHPAGPVSWRRRAPRSAAAGPGVRGSGQGSARPAG
jgi:indolepyruvate ferredoxin oxidoreductase